MLSREGLSLRNRASSGLLRTNSEFLRCLVVALLVSHLGGIRCLFCTTLAFVWHSYAAFLRSTLSLSNFQYGKYDDPWQDASVLAWMIPTTVKSKVVQRSDQYHHWRVFSSRRDPVFDNERYSPISWNMRKKLKWIASTVQKLLVHENAYEFWYSNVDSYPNFTVNLVDSLVSLSEARCESQVLAVGSTLETMVRDKSLLEGTSLKIQERVIKAACVAGLLDNVALPIMHHIILDRKLVPSPFCQDSFFSSLRKAGKVDDMEDILKELGMLCHIENRLNDRQGQVSGTSFNIYLASLCDVVTNDNKRQYQTYNGKRYMFFTDNEKYGILDHAVQWIKSDKNTPNVIYGQTSSKCQAHALLGINPDIVSYATLMQAAAVVGNETLVEMLWKDIMAQNMQPNIVAYNARMRVISSKKRKDNQDKRDIRTLEIWDEIIKDRHVRPDRYSIDSVLLPLSRKERFSDVERLLDSFIPQNSETLISDSFAAFLGTLVNANELTTASMLFETYVAPSLAPVVFGNAGSMRMIRPTAKHFNIMLSGYRQNFHKASSKSVISDAQYKSSQSSLVAAWNLFNVMRETSIVRPDAYTITIMMGLCTNSTQLSNLLHEASASFEVDLRSVVLRASLTAYGELSDPDSALWIFYHFGSKSTRTWNTLLGAMVKSANSFGNKTLEPSTSSAARDFVRPTSLKSSQTQIAEMLKNSTLCEAIQIIVHSMSNAVVYVVDAPPANSQTFCIAASALQHNSRNTSNVRELFKQATEKGFAADGRFLNAIIRGYGEDIEAALQDWKKEIRYICVTENNNSFWSKELARRYHVDNLLASYNGLLHVCGRALRPDVALRIVYAMKKDGIEANEISLNSYKSGKQIRGSGGATAGEIFKALQLVKVYESFLEVECLKYDHYDTRRKGERRVRIIV